jgi:hypothetical protein
VPRPRLLETAGIRLATIQTERQVDLAISNMRSCLAMPRDTATENEYSNHAFGPRLMHPVLASVAVRLMVGRNFCRLPAAIAVWPPAQRS